MDKGSKRGSASSTSHPALWQKDWRECSELTSAATPSKGVGSRSDPSSVSSNGATSDAASVESTKSRIPKYFDVPLTCFYWYQFGHCKKAGEECLYAHWDTGHVAAAPFKLESEQRAVAGRNGVKQLDKHMKQQQEFNDKEAWLTAREMQLNSKSAAAPASQAIEGVTEGVYQIISDAKAVLYEALVTLNHHNEAIAVDDEDIRDKASKVVHDATVGIANINERLIALEAQFERQLGGQGPSPGSVRVYVDDGQS